MKPPEPILLVESLFKHYLGPGGARHDILRDVNLRIEESEFVCILGRSGCGKTTLLRCLAGLEDYGGRILLRGDEVSRPGPDRVMVFQEFNQLLPWKTVAKNVALPLKVAGALRSEEINRLTREYLSKVNLWDYRDFYPHQLSGGMKQRVAIARSLAMKPKLILMDEPFASLDAMTRKKLQAELRQITSEEKTTVVFITHNIQEALALSSRYLVLNSGGEFLLDKSNPLPKPTTPSTPGFAAAWDEIDSLLQDPSA